MGEVSVQAQPGPKPAVDPYFAWAAASGFADYGTTSDDTLFTVLAECHNAAGVVALNQSMKAWAGNDTGALAGVTPAYLIAPAGRSPARSCQPVFALFMCKENSLPACPA